MFIQTQDTPNPNALKFFPGCEIAPQKPMHFSKKTEATGVSVLVTSLFAVQDVSAVFLGNNFITITKSDQSDWNIIKPELLMIMMDHFSSNLPVFDNSGFAKNSLDIDTHENINTITNLSEIEKQIIEIIDTRVRPSVAMDGGDIIYKSFDEKNGVVKLQLRGACSGCPSSTITLKQGIESMLQHFIPEVLAVEAAEEDH